MVFQFHVMAQASFVQVNRDHLTRTQATFLQDSGFLNFDHAGF